MSKFGESGQIICSLNVSKNYFSPVFGHNFGQNSSFLLKILKIGAFLGLKWPHMSKFGKIGQIFFSLKVYKNYFSQVYGHNFSQKCH